MVGGIKAAAALSAIVSILIGQPAESATVSGTLQQWHRVEVDFTGPGHAETDSNPNPFLDYRLQCTFTGPSGQVYDVPGFFDTNGSGGSSGNVWTCRFAPDEAGAWQYSASFRQGTAVAVSLQANAGSPTSFNGDSGSFTVAASSRAAPDFRAPGRGRLLNLGSHYLQFLGSGTRWIKGGPDIPENFFGYSGFDNTPDAGHSFSSHVQDWNPGDPDWNGGAGRGIIGALNYIASTGGNSIYFLPMNIGGDGQDTFPTVAEQNKTHYDASKLHQWETVFTHADARGIFLHFQLAETESGNENYHDNGTLGPQRKLYYRELIARFGHHLGIEWDLGEENDYGTAKREAFAAHIKAVDPYDHPVTTHIHTNQMEGFYGPLVGNGDFDMTTFQITESGLDNGFEVEEWRARSAAAGVPWVVSIDEPQTIENDPTDEANGYPNGRKDFMWPIYLSGGGGFEWYVQENGGGHSFDQRIDNLREMQVALQWTRHAHDFMSTIPFWEMDPDQSLGSSSAGGTTYVLAKPGQAYAAYNDGGGAFSLDLSGQSGTYAVSWFNPRTGSWHGGGNVAGGGVVNLGTPPFSSDAAVRLLRIATGNPIAQFSASPQNGPAPLPVALDAGASTDDGIITSYAWSFGDGDTGSGEQIQHTFVDPGTFTVVLTVTDNDGKTDQTSTQITVTDPNAGGTLTFSPVEDAYVEGAAGFNNSFLKVEPGSRESYLKFTVSGVTGSVSTVRLLLKQSTDASSGITMTVRTANGNNWSESTLNASNAPTAGAVLASFSGSVGSGATVMQELGPGAAPGNGTYSFIVSSSSGNDVWFGSSETAAPPVLEVVVGGATGPMCGNGVPEAGEACDGGECCGATCQYDPDGTPCNDGDTCTPASTCMAGVCTSVAGPGACVDDFLCYKAGTSAGAPRLPSGTQVNVADAFEDKAFDLKKKRGLCNPAAVDGEAIVDAVTHFTAYQVRRSSGEERHVRRANLRVTNRFGEITLDTKTTDRLLVPAAKDLDSPVSPPDGATHEVDPYQCYKVNVSRGTPKFPKDIVAHVVDQFGEPKLMRVKKPKLLCAAADTASAGIKNPDVYLLCYQIRSASGEPKHTRLTGIHTADDFIVDQVDTIKEEFLCVPSLLSTP
jgi:PKD repeat protein